MAPPLRALHLAVGLAERLVASAVAAAPREACGLLLGRLEAEGVRVEEVSEVRNLERRGRGFSLDPVGHLAAERRAAKLGLTVVGAWHSHPAGDPRPSVRDLGGTPRGWCCLVVAPGPGGKVGFGAWWRASDRFEALLLPDLAEGRPPPSGLQVGEPSIR